MKLLNLFFLLFIITSCKNNKKIEADSLEPKEPVLYGKNILIDTMIINSKLFEYFTYRENLILKNNSMDPYLGAVKYNNEYAYLLTQDWGKEIKKGEEIEIIKFNNKHLEKYHITAFEDIWIKGYDINDNLLAILGDESFYIFKKENKKFKLDYSLPCPKSCEIIEIDNDKVILFNFLYGNIFDGKNPELYIYNVNNKSKEKQITMEKPLGSALTFFQPRRTFGVYNNKVFISDITKYLIKIYDLDKNLIAEINRSPKNWHNNKNVCEYMEKLNSLDKFRAEIKKFEYLCSINLVDFINDSTLLICWNGVTHNQFYYDIWQSSNDDWKLLDSNLICRKYNENEKFDLNNFPIINCQYLIKEGKIIIPGKHIPFSLKNAKFFEYTYGELYENIDKYFIKNKPVFSVLLYDFLLNKKK